MTSGPNSVLFDKGVIRRVYERRVRLAAGNPPTILQIEASNCYARICKLTDRLYITEQTSNILRLRPKIFAEPFLADLQSLKKARYLRRWARRLKDFSFSPEDAIILAYGSFGFDLEKQTVGVDMIVTTDQGLEKNYFRNFDQIEKRFKDMILNLPEPYKDLRLPRVITTATVLTGI